MISHSSAYPTDKITLTKILTNKIQQLSADQQQDVLNLVDTLLNQSASNRNIWDKIAEITQEIPQEDWEKLPTDGAQEHDHYLYKTPKQYS